MTGQMAVWAMEVWYIVVIGFLNTLFKLDPIRELAPIVKYLEFVVVPFIQVKTSAPIQQYLASLK